MTSAHLRLAAAIYLTIGLANFVFAWTLDAWVFPAIVGIFRLARDPRTAVMRQEFIEQVEDRVRFHEGWSSLGLLFVVFGLCWPVRIVRGIWKGIAALRRARREERAP